MSLAKHPHQQKRISSTSSTPMRKRKSKFQVEKASSMDVQELLNAIREKIQQVL